MSSMMKLNKTELKEMSDTMSDAFLFHENFQYLIPNRKRRKNALYNLFQMMYKAINRNGYIYVVSHNSERIGYITFMDDSKHKLDARIVLKTKGVYNSFLFLVYTGFRNLTKFRKYMKAYSQVLHGGSGDTIHLYSTGIMKSYRGMGFMRLPFEKSFEYFKSIGYKNVELETSDKSNLVIYKKMGFKITKEITSVDKKQIIYFFKLEL